MGVETGEKDSMCIRRTYCVEMGRKCWLRKRSGDTGQVSGRERSNGLDRQEQSLQRFFFFFSLNMCLCPLHSVFRTEYFGILDC